LDQKFIKITRVLPILLLIGVVTAVVHNYSRRSQLFEEAKKPVVRPLPPNASELIEGFTLYQSEKGQTIVELRAKLRLGFKDNKSLFESVSARFLGKDGSRDDLIRSERCEYDEATEEIVFIGNVVITLRTTPRQTASPNPATSAEPITLKMDRITYRKTQALADTDREVKFFRGRMHGECRGMSYNFQQEILRLHQSVRILIDPSRPSEPQARVEAGALEYSHQPRMAEFRSQVSVRKGKEEMSAEMLRIFLDENQAVTRAEAAGQVRTISLSPENAIELTAPQVHYFFSPGGRWLERVAAWEKVKVRSLEPGRPRHLASDFLEVDMVPQKNLVRQIRARGHATGSFSGKETNRPPAPASVPSSASSASAEYRVHAQEIHFTFQTDGKAIQTVDTRGGSRIEEIPAVPGIGRRVISAQESALFFTGADSRLERMTADRQVRVELFDPAKKKESWSDHLLVFFDPESNRARELRQFGNFRYQDPEWTASAREARFLETEKITTLIGSPLVRDARSKISADLLELHETESLVKARGNVRTTLETGGPENRLAAFREGAPVYVSAENLDLDTQNEIAHYWAKVRLWQEAQMLRADSVFLQRKEKKLVAEQNVSTWFFLEEHAPRVSPIAASSLSPPQPTLVQAGKLVYLEVEQSAVYEQNVRMRHSLGLLQSDRLEVFLEREKETGRSTPRRMLARGHVRITQPGRLATAEEAEYLGREDKVVLAGGPPRIIDSARGSTSGARLTMYRNSDSIFVEGDSETRSYAKPSRVSP
jgi:LPS export ABC transporter protein LptC